MKQKLKWDGLEWVPTERKREKGCKTISKTKIISFLKTINKTFGGSDKALIVHGKYTFANSTGFFVGEYLHLQDDFWLYELEGNGYKPHLIILLPGWQRGWTEEEIGRIEILIDKMEDQDS